MSRPTVCTPELTEKICSLIAEGLSLRTICSAEDMPDKSNVFRWLAKDASFRDQYAIACEQRSEALVEDMLEISDDLTEEPNSRRIRIDTRKWIASKLKPKKYGDKIAVGGDPNGEPINHSVTLTIVRPDA